jgi:nucleotide-binding universal stress UspA family protein
MYKRILLPTDGTEFCERAIRHGVDLAKRLGANVVGMTVTQPLHSAVPLSFIPKNLAGIIYSETVKLADEKLSAVRKAAEAAGVQADLARVSDDHPWQGIIDIAHEKNCDLIVMASHGRRGLAGVVLGSETHKVLTHTKIPVLVVRWRGDASRSRLWTLVAMAQLGRLCCKVSSEQDQATYKSHPRQPSRGNEDAEWG